MARDKGLTPSNGRTEGASVGVTGAHGEPLSPDGWLFRCSECGTGEHLAACAESIVSGRLLPEGDVEESSSEQHTVFEDSIDCDVHVGARIEKFVGGRWTICVACPGGVRKGYEGRDDEHYECKDGVLIRYGSPMGRCATCGGRGSVDVPVADLDPSSTGSLANTEPESAERSPNPSPSPSPSVAEEV